MLMDASVWLAAYDAHDRFHASSRALVGESEKPVAALDLTLYEVGNVATLRWRDVERARALARLLPVRCENRILSVDPDMVEDAAMLAAQTGISVYDAAYAVQARAHGWTLVSGDLRDLVGNGLAITPPEAAAAG